MIFRIVKVGNHYEIEGSFNRSRLSRWLRLEFGGPHWYWIVSFDTLEEAIANRNYLLSDRRNRAVAEVVVAG